ncbi:autotransporter domain-containing protein [Proteus sp. G2618]|uniref:autotransporter domain-containing protein n=3 Tax=Proteus TaxID=583 RepID=UPI001F3BFBE4|nr:autotransporter domain-containing protein [Proteus sp. G2618]
MKIKYKSILLITYSIYIFPINSHANYNIKDMGNSIYKPFSISNNANQYYQLREKKYEDIKYRHGKILDKGTYNQRLVTSFGSVYIYTAIDDDTLFKYNTLADNINNEIQKEHPSYNIRNSSFFDESILPSELFISTDGGITRKKINKGSDERLDTLYLDRSSYNGEVIVGYATASKSRLTEINYDMDNCSGYPLCHTFIYNSKNNIFTILDNKINIHHLTKDGNFILYSSKKEKNLHIYDIAKKESFILSIENINHYLPEHPEKDRLLLEITSPPFLDKIKKRNVDIQKVSDNAQVIIGQLNRKLSKKQLIDAGYPKVAFIAKKEGPIKEVSYSDFGSSKLTAFSENGNYSVGWGEIWHADYEIKLPHSIKKSSSLFSHALLYDFSNDKLKNIGNLSEKAGETQFRNARAMDISADGKYIVGWSETDHYNYDTIPKDSSKRGPEAFIMFHRHGFLYLNEKMYDLGTLDEGNDSEAHSITDDGRIIYGLSTDKHNNWRQVIWKNNEISNEYFNNEKQKFVDEAKEQQRLAEEAKEKQRLADEAKEQQRLADEAKEKQRLADEAKEKQRLADEAKEKQRLADEAKEQQRLADEAKEKQRLADEAKEKQRLADEAREKQRLADEAREKQRLADEAREKQRLADEAREKQRLADEAKEKQRLADEAKEKQRLADEAREQQRLADEAREQQRLADEAREKQRLAKEAKTQEESKDIAEEKAKELIPVEDELELRAKEKEITKPSIIISKPIDIESTYKSMQLMAENGYKLIDMQQGQLRYLASATCSVGTEKACISGFTHYQNVNKANATQTGLSGAYRFDINHIPLVVGLAIDTDVYSSLPKGYQYQGYALPLIGFSLDLMPSLNAELNNNALHFSLKGAYLNRKVSIERAALANTESGKGNAKISGYHIDLKAYYPYSLTNNLLLTPFVGLTFNQISRSAYSETQNAQFAAHYDALKTHSLFAKIGLGVEHLLGSSFILNTKAGLLWNLSHYQGDFRSHIDYLGQQQIDYSENKKQVKQRPFANVGVTYQFDKQSSVNTSANWEMTTYRNHDMQIGVSYTYRF